MTTDNVRTEIAVERGEVWELPDGQAPLRVMCGSAFSPRDVRRLCGERSAIGLALVDPPFTPGATIRDVEQQFLRVWGAIEILEVPIVAFWCGWNVLGAVLSTARAYNPRWVFALAQETQAAGHTVDELVVWAPRGPNGFMVRGVIRPIHGDARPDHPAEKNRIPVEELFKMADREGVGRGVYEPFAGSGKFAMMAAAAGRPAFAMESEPAVASAMVNRWQAGTPRRAE